MCKVKATKIKSNPTEDNNQYNTRHVQGKGNQNQINKQLKVLRIFHQTPDLREQENAVWDKFRLGSLESFNPATQKIYQLLPTIIHTIERSTKASTILRAIWRTLGAHQEKQRLVKKWIPQATTTAQQQGNTTVQAATGFDTEQHRSKEKKFFLG
jgi:hypothetical protein